eukprot:CAMPEP_0201721082 /NCGR_PEP_ID=MMETSP0593-20130828/5856_1 /ASSEMBLY_ACC=CAM_ASM_000672 /TAXON_ID=267983 /ORGANISM="Skeletonema japonicum, Strain CCMP2506" /LENGTH=686 /DNA_ID=CAMNT_0048211827 /DNA_START=14 /DNA_END=2074 /DNA_ORIENTATION=-
MNPFDQFADTLQAALPPQQQQRQNGDANSVAGSAQAQAQQQQPHQFNLMVQPAAEKKPIMNAGMMMSPQQQQQQMGMYGGGMYGQPQQQQPQQQPTMQQNNTMMAPSNSVNMGGFMGNSMTSLGGAPPPTTPNAVMAGALVPSVQQSNPYALGPPAAAAASPYANGAPPPPPQNYSPYGGPPTPQQLQQQPQQQQPNQMMAVDPFSGGASVAPQQPADPWGGAQSVVSQQQQHQQQPSNALVPSNAPPSNDPFGVFGGFSGGGQSVLSAAPPAQQYQQPPAPVQQQQQLQQHQQQYQQPPVAAPAPVAVENDPWNVFAEAPPASAAPPQQQQAPQQLPLDEGDLFDGGIGAAATRANQEANKAAEAAAASNSASEPPQHSSNGGTRKKGELPPGGEWYDAKIFTPTLGVMFFKPKELVDSLFLQTDKEMVDSLDERPVVAFIVEGSSARSAGVELGHVLLKVNGIDVKNPKEASRLIKEGPRPLPLLFYVPETQVVVAEGEHMVKYNTKETGAPNSAKDWKPKYVVIGGIIAQPWMINMYRSKSEYDIAVIETQARRPVSVKVKQFSLQGARVQNDWQGPQMVKYKNKLHPWKYIVILPVSRNPIKIASPNLNQLRPVHEGVRRVLMAQQRDRGTGGGGGGGGPRRQPDPYRGGGGGGRSSNDRGYDTRDRRNDRPDYDGDRRGGY